jgi:multidrug efflux pump
MRLWLDPARLAAFGLTPLDVKRALDRENVELPAGKLSGDRTELTVKTNARLRTLEAFEQLILREDGGGRFVRLLDVGHAELGPENEETILRQSGVPMIGLAVVPQPGANLIDIADEFYRRMEQLKKELPADYRVDIALDNTVFVRRSITEVVETLGIAIALVVLIIYLFFRDWVVAFRPLIDIPVSLVGTFFIMYVLGYSINVLTLLAIVLATGLVVDDGIVVTENIYKRIERGLNPVQAAIEGTQEIFFAVVSTSVTLAAVFLPIIFMEGFVGKLFQEFGIVLAGSVLISAFVSLTLTPMLNAHLVRKHSEPGWLYRVTEPIFVGMENSYRRALDRFLKRRWLALPIVALSVGLIFWVGGLLPNELAPLEDRSAFRVSVTAPEGASYEYTDFFMKKLTALVLDSVPEKKVLLSVTAPGFTGSGAVNTGFMRFRLTDPDERARSQQQIADYITAKMRAFPEARCFVIQDQTISTGGTARFGLPVQYVIQAPNFDRLREVLPKFLEEANKEPVFQGVDVNLKFNKPELDLSIDRERAQSLGVSVLDIAQTLQLGFSGVRFGYFPLNDRQYQVIGQFDRANRDEPLDLSSMYVRNAAGQLIQLDNLVQIEEKSSPPQLYHYNRYMSATVSAGLAPGKTIGDGIAAMDAIAARVLSPDFSTELTGASRDFQESSSNALFAFGLALLLIYLILAAQFESFVSPFIIMLTVPLALAGAVLTLWYFNETLNIFSQIGIIMLIGLVTKNGILLVEFSNQLRQQGQPLAEAVRNGAAARLRPILMTSLATALGALPIALALGAGSESRKGMGMVIVGGVLFALVLTLFVVPAAYTLLAPKKVAREPEGEN